MAVDDLFDGPAPPPPEPDPIPGLQRWLSAAGMMVTAGLCCPTGPIGAFVAVWVWARAGDAMARAEAGLHPPLIGRAALRVRNMAFGLMVASMLSLLLQAFLFSAGIYNWLLEGLLGAIGGLWSSV